MMTSRTLITALALSLGAALSAQAQSIPDLPRLTWPTVAPITAPATQSCTDASQPGAPHGCLKS